MADSRHIYLFDIDGTLVSAQGVGGQAFRRAAREVLGYELTWQSREFAGMTDAGLFRRAISESGMETSEKNVAAFRDLYHDYLALNLRERPALILTGVEQIIERVASATDAIVGLLTGNTARASELKLVQLFKKFELGFFGDDHAERNALSVHARGEIHSRFGAESQITIIGDTPNDIACARAAGMNVVAVATGLYSAEELAHADRVVRNLTEW